VLLVLNGFVNFVVAQFDPVIFADATYWLKTLTGSASGLSCLHYICVYET
jgi:hypothetical protein